MIIYVIYSMIYVGSALMLFNVCGYFRFAFKNSSREGSWKNNVVLYIPFALVVLFLFGYLGVAIWGNPDLLVAAILFGGSIFVFVVFLLLHSITKKIKMKEEVEAKLRAAEESRQAKTAFLSEVSHEMRTPLNIILGVDTLAFKDSSLSQENLGRFEKIDSSAKYLLGLVNNILDMNSIDSGELSLKNEEFSLNGILAASPQGGYEFLWTRAMRRVPVRRGTVPPGPQAARTCPRRP